MKEAQQKELRKDLKNNGEYYEVVIKRHGKELRETSVVAQDLETLILLLRSDGLLERAALTLIKI